MTPHPFRSERTLVFTATYNEVSNIDEWYERVRAVLPDAWLLVVDDNSPDGTGVRLQELAAADDALTVVTRSTKSGLGSAHRLAIQHALVGDFDVLVTMDADLSHQPEEIDRLLEALESSDFVIGSRKLGTLEYSGIRLVISRTGNALAQLAIPTGLTEYTTSFRAFARDTLNHLAEHPSTDDGYAFFMEIIYTLHQAGFRLAEVPITFKDRCHGKSKIPRHQILLSIRVLARLSMQRLIRARTMKATRGRSVD